MVRAIHCQTQIWQQIVQVLQDAKVCRQIQQSISPKNTPARF